MRDICGHACECYKCSKDVTNGKLVFILYRDYVSKPNQGHHGYLPVKFSFCSKDCLIEFLQDNDIGAVGQYHSTSNI
jgi:hypothetical protein